MITEAFALVFFPVLIFLSPRTYSSIFKYSGREFFGSIGKDNFKIIFRSSQKEVLDFGSRGGYLEPLNQMTHQHMNAGPKSAMWMHYAVG